MTNEEIQRLMESPTFEQTKDTPCDVILGMIKNKKPVELPSSYIDSCCNICRTLTVESIEGFMCYGSKTCLWYKDKFEGGDNCFYD